MYLRCAAAGRIFASEPQGFADCGGDVGSEAACRAGQRMSEQEGAKTIRLAERRVFSQYFKPLYEEGMGLVEQAAAYLDGPGRAEAKKLSRPAATLYAAESMRLTTRLMQVASWLLLQRAANSGEMSREQVAVEKSKVRLDTASAQADAAGWSELPAGFVDLVDRSLSLQALVRRMDDEIYGKSAAARRSDTGRSTNPVSDQITLLNTAFARG
jgi:regulator of CtrA degradation